MRIVNLTTFLALPDGILFAKYKPMYFESLSMKLATCPNHYGGAGDFCSVSLTDDVECSGSDEFHDILTAAMEDGAHFSMDPEGGGRDGCFEADQLFAVWEADDIAKLIAVLQKAVPA